MYYNSQLYNLHVYFLQLIHRCHILFVTLSIIDNIEIMTAERQIQCLGTSGLLSTYSFFLFLKEDLFFLLEEEKEQKDPI